MKQLKIYVTETQTPFQILNYFVAVINYGGRITDNKDERLMVSLLQNFFNSDLLVKQNYKIMGQVHLPVHLDYEDILGYIRDLPEEDDPAIFGMHQNSNITF